MGGDYLVNLEKPLEKDIASETKVRMHLPRDSSEHVKKITAKNEWVSDGRRIQVLPKAIRAQIFIMAAQPILFQDVHIEVFPKNLAE